MLYLSSISLKKGPFNRATKALTLLVVGLICCCECFFLFPLSPRQKPPPKKAFLKERGHVDSYPLVEVSWQRGHDPEVEFWNCDGRPPSKLKGEKPALTVALSPYETTELHSLLHLRHELGSCFQFSC